MRIGKLNTTAIIFITAILGLAFSSSHPTTGSGGYTGGPGDGTCAQSGCHNSPSSGITGNVTVTGFPANITGGVTYTLTVNVHRDNANTIRAGFQLLALTGTNGNAGSMVALDPNTAIKMGGGKNYFGHEPATFFGGVDDLSFDVAWTAPVSAGSNPIIKFYAVSILGNNMNDNGGDRAVFFTTTVPITGSALPLDAVISNPVNPTCFDSNNGRATVTASGGAGSYTYEWSSGATTATATNLPDGLSTVTVSDGTNNIVKEVNLTAPEELMAVASSTNTCVGQNNGTATVIANGGTGNRTYLWSNGATTVSITNLAAGVYTVTVKDANNCTKSDATTVAASTAMVLTPLISNTSCNGGNDGMIMINIAGGTNPYSYNWSNGSNANPATNLSSSIFSVTVTDQANCTKTGSYTVSQPTVISANVNITSNVTCPGGSNGAASLSISGGSPNYTYDWSTGATGSGNTGNISGLIAGNYSVTITDFLDCEKIVNFTITQPLPVTVPAPNVQNVSCFGLTNGSISIAPTGGNAPYTYLWSTGNTTNNIANLAPGSFSVTIKDVNNCQKVESYSITQPILLTSSITITQNINCSNGSNGSLQIVAAGGTIGYNYLWSNNSTSQSITNLSAGNYMATVTDSKGCTSTSSSTLATPQPIIVTQTAITPAGCGVAQNGSTTILASNGNPPYTYAWSTGANGQTLSNVSSGNYIATVTDNSGCTNVNVYTIGTSTSFTLSALSSTNVTCHGDSTGAAAVLTNPTYTYLWSNGKTGASVTNLPADSITVVATDGLGCKSAPLLFVILQTPKLSPQGITVDSLLCENDILGSISIDTLVGGLGLISYEWSSQDTSFVLDSLVSDSLPVGIYTLQLTDTPGCLEVYKYKILKTPPIKIESSSINEISCFKANNGSIELKISGGYKKANLLWNTGSISDSIYNLNAGTYTLSIRDSAQCTINQSFEIKKVDSLFAILATIPESQAGKNDGKIITTINGGTGPYTILWSNGRTTIDIEGLAPGIYNYQITDGNGCVAQGFGVIVGGGCTLTATYTIKKPICNNGTDGEILLNVPSNVISYKVQIFKNGNIALPGLTNLGVGTYTVIIEDNIGCQFILQNIVLDAESPAMSLTSFEPTKPSSTTSTNGSLKAVIVGGTLPLIYKWTKGGQPIIGNSASITNLTVGNYSLEVTDAKGCLLSDLSYVLDASSSSNELISQSISLTPNPAQYTLSISIPIEYTVNNIIIQNDKGQTILKPVVNPNVGKLDINVSAYPSGLYFMTCLINNQWVTKRFVINR